MKKVCYGLALPGVLLSTVLITHVSSPPLPSCPPSPPPDSQFPAKLLFVRILRNSKHLTTSTPTHWITWLSSVAGITLISYIVASAVPIFGGLVSLIGGLLVPLMSFQPMGMMWLYDNYNTRSHSTWSWKVGFGCSVGIIIFGCFIMVAGTYGAVVDIIETYRESGGTLAWSCADNSNSV
jgi:hypothetical protein